MKKVLILILALIVVFLIGCGCGVFLKPEPPVIDIDNDTISEAFASAIVSVYPVQFVVNWVDMKAFEWTITNIESDNLNQFLNDRSSIEMITLNIYQLSGWRPDYIATYATKTNN